MSANSKWVFREVLWIRRHLNRGLMSHVGIYGNHISGWRKWKAKNLRRAPILTLGSSMWLALAHGMFANTMASNDLQSVCVSSCCLTWLGIFSFFKSALSWGHAQANLLEMYEKHVEKNQHHIKPATQLLNIWECSARSSCSAFPVHAFDYRHVSDSSWD